MVCVVPPEQHSSWIGYKEKRRWHPNEEERVKLRKNERCEVRYGSLAGKCRDCKGDKGLACLGFKRKPRTDQSSSLNTLVASGSWLIYVGLALPSYPTFSIREHQQCPSLVAFFTIKCFFTIYTNNSGIRKHNSLS